MHACLLTCYNMQRNASILRLWWGANWSEERERVRARFISTRATGSFVQCNTQHTVQYKRIESTLNQLKSIHSRTMYIFTIVEIKISTNTHGKSTHIHRSTAEQTNQTLDHLILSTILYYPLFFVRYIATHKLLHDARMNLFLFFVVVVVAVCMCMCVYLCLFYMVVVVVAAAFLISLRFVLNHYNIAYSEYVPAVTRYLAERFCCCCFFRVRYIARSLANAHPFACSIAHSPRMLAIATVLGQFYYSCTALWCCSITFLYLSNHIFCLFITFSLALTHLLSSRFFLLYLCLSLSVCVFWCTHYTSLGP